MCMVDSLSELPFLTKVDITNNNITTVVCGVTSYVISYYVLLCHLTDKICETIL